MLRINSATKQSPTKQGLLRFAAQKQNAQPVAYPLDSSFRWNDEDDTPVIPGEQRETRNPGVPCFCLHV